MYREVPSNELITILIVIGLIIISITKILYPKRLNDFIFVPGNTKYFKIYHKEQKIFDKFDSLLFINLILSSGIFGFLCIQSYYGKTINNFNVVFELSLAIGLFILIKLIIERLIGNLFELDKLITQYLFQKISFKNYLGLFLLPINGILTYVFPKSLISINITLILLLIINLIGLLTSFKTHETIIKNHLFYFIVYICALEIAPYIILYKVLNVYV